MIKVLTVSAKKKSSINFFKNYLILSKRFWLSICTHNAWPMLFSCCIYMLIVLMLSLTAIIIPPLFHHHIFHIPSFLKTVSYPGIAISSSSSIRVSTMHIIVGFVSSTASVSGSTFDLIPLIFLWKIVKCISAFSILLLFLALVFLFFALFSFDFLCSLVVSVVFLVPLFPCFFLAFQYSFVHC